MRQILFCYLFLVLFPKVAVAQITPDSSLGAESSKVERNGNRDTINGGAKREGNLFHSFEDFNVQTEREAYFANPEGVNNIFSRITGNNISNIDGVLGVSGNANLYLINPNGIIFGANASLNVNGSFVATTADSILFRNGIEFSAANQNIPPLLTVDIPLGLKFRDNPGAIINKAQSPQKALLSGQFNPAGLLVMSNQTLALIGGEIFLEGGNITAEGGSIELGSVGQNSLVGLELTESGIVFDYQAVENFSDITLTNREGFILEVELDENGIPNFLFTQSSIASFLNSNSTTQTGSINIQGRNINILNGSQISTSTIKDTNAGNITIIAKDKLTVKDSNQFNTQVKSQLPDPISAAIFSTTVEDGNAGNIKITSNKLEVANFANISSDTNSIFDGVTDIPANGGGGNIDITTEELLISNNGAIRVSTEGTGNAGNITIKTRSLIITEKSEISAETVRSKGGNINLQIDNNLELRNQSNISALIGDIGNGGNINIDAEFLITSPQDNSDIIATARDSFGGNIRINSLAIIGFEKRNKITELSDIIATATFSSSAQANRLNSSLLELKSEIIDASQLITQNVCQQTINSEFVDIGKGGLPENPNNFLQANNIEVGLVAPTLRAEKVLLNKPENRDTMPEITPIITSRETRKPPAQGWIQRDNGLVELIAQNPDRLGEQRNLHNDSNC